MKTSLSYTLSVLLLFLGMTAWVAVPVKAEAEKRILIINSYSERVEWSKDLMDSLEYKIRETYPDWMVYSGDLKTESATYSSAAALTLRSILWGYAERTRTCVDATTLEVSSIFMQDDIPDAIVWIGEEGFLHYLSYIFLMKKWKQIPMVLCAVSDSISASGWFPEKGFSFDLKYGIRDYNVITRLGKFSEKYLKQIKEDKSIRISKREDMGADVYYLETDLNYSGNIAQFPVRQNLELIQRMLPGLQELIWVDDDYYRSAKIRLEVEEIMKKVMPEVKFSKMIHNRMNTDSIYDVMLEPAPHRAFLTYSWNIDGLHSKRSDQEIDSLFTYVSTVPLFTMTARDFSKDNYWLGGCYLERPKVVENAVALLNRAVKGDTLMSIPFDTLSQVRTVLNKTALERYGLTSAADKLENVTYEHIPPTFLRKYERQLLVAILILSLVVCYLVISWRRSRYNKSLQADYARYKRLYDKLQVIYANSSIDFALYDGQGKRLLRIVNGETEEMCKQCDLFFENVFESPYLSDELKEQIRSGQVINCEVSVDANGKVSRSNFTGEVYQLIVKPLHEVNYHSSSFMAIAINLTPAIRERREKERFESLFHFASNSSQLGVAFYDVNTAEGMATASWCKNMSETFCSGTFPVYEHVVAEDREALLKFQYGIRAGEMQEALCKDIRVIAEDGETHWIRQHMYYVHTSKRLIELSLDIDEQKQHEKRLEEAKQKAEESNEETKLFLGSISHEVRTPLNAIVGFSAILGSSDDKDITKDYGPIITRNTSLLESLINNILDLSALDAGKVRFQYARVNIADLFIDMETYIRSNLYDHPLRFIRELPECEADRFITTDQEYLRTLLLNLLSNAVKFTEKGSITLGCRKEKRGFYFYVTDTGCGFSSEDQMYIFNRFVKLDTFIQGTGLGLSLCKSIVKHLGGEIGVVSEKGKGSTFWFVLPYVE